MKAGKRVTRAVWASGRDDWHGAFAEIREVPGYEPQIMVGYAGGTPRPFAGAQWDLLSDDWQVLD
jgi:hypothetical protein